MTTKPRRAVRRPAILALSCIALTLASVVAAMPADAASTLKSAAAARGRVFGAAVANNHLGEAAYANTLDTEFNGVTPENEMKWDATEPNRNQFTFGAADNIVNHARTHGQSIRGHTLVWHSQLPGWVNNIGSGTDLLNAMRSHINGLMGHWRGQIAYWDVVNEAFADGSGGGLRSSIWTQRTGFNTGFIEQAFRAARAADGNAKLCYNDYNTDGMNAKSNAVFNMVSDFKNRGVPIDCVGFQSHLNINGIPGDYQANLQRFANLGVDVQITELDIQGSDRNAQANNYRTVVSACMAVARCNRITTWGVTDKYSWRASGTPLLFDGNFAKKPAYTTTLQAMGG
jgi:endo-1,4-beta-xylanase